MSFPLTGIRTLIRCGSMACLHWTLCLVVLSVQSPGLLAQSDQATVPAANETASPPVENLALENLPDVIPLLHDYDEAIEQAEKTDRPVLVIVGAEWCGPCKVLENDLQQKVAEPILGRWIVVKIDMDREPGLAREWEVNAVPAFRILGIDQAVLASNEGYGGFKKLEEWLEEQFDAVNPKTQRLFQEDKPVDAEMAKELVLLLKDRKASNRKIAIDRLSRYPAIAAPSVAQLLVAGNLSQKICAVELLQKWGAPVKGIDPWAAEAISNDQARSLDDWVASSTQ